MKLRAILSIMGALAAGIAGATQVSSTAVTKNPATNEISESLVVPSGKSLIIRGTIDASNATVVGLSTAGGAWGGITGTISAQTDLQNALNLKANSSTLGSAATRDVGTITGTVAAGDDARLTDARTPVAHTQAVSTISDSTTVGQNLVKLTNPGAISVPVFGADNSVRARIPSDFRSDIGLGSSATHASTDFDASGAAAAVTPASLSLTIGTNTQAYSATLTTWAGITPATNVGTFLATPSGANFAAVLTSAVPTSKGGTGLTTIGTSYQALRVNAGATGLEFATAADASTNASSSVDSEVALFSSTTGKLLKRASGTGIATLSSGVLGTITDSHTNWDSAYSYRLTGATGTAPITVTLAANALTVGATTASATNGGVLTSGDWTNFNAGYTYRVTGASGTAPVTASLAANALTVSMTQATTSNDGFLSHTDWATFNGKQAAGNYLTSASVASAANHVFVSAGATRAQVETPVTIDFSGNLAGIGTVAGTGLSVTGGKMTLNGGATPSVTAFGDLSSDNNIWATGRGAPVFYDGTAAVALVGTLVSDTPTNGQVPMWNTGGTITWESLTELDPLVAAINGLVKSNGTTISAATPGTDYLTKATRTVTFSLTIDALADSMNYGLGFVGAAFTITEIRAVHVGAALSSPSILLKVYHGTDRSSGTAAVTAGTTVTSSTSGGSVTSFDSAACSANSWLWITTGSKSGTTDKFEIVVRGTYD